MTLLYTVGVVIALVFTSLAWRWASRHGFIHLSFALAGASWQVWTLYAAYGVHYGGVAAQGADHGGLKWAEMRRRHEAVASLPTTI